MISIAELEKNMKDQAWGLVSDFFVEMKKLNNRVIEKDAHIIRLEEEIEKAEDRLEIALKEIEHMKKLDLEREKLIEKLEASKLNGKYLLIYRPSDIFKCGPQVISDYVKKISFEELEFEQIEDFFIEIIEYGDWNLVDLGITRFSESRLENIRPDELESILITIRSYILSQLRENRISLKGIFEFIKRINGFKWTELLEGFIEEFYVEIEMIVDRAPREELSSLFGVELLKTYFLLSKDMLLCGFLDKMILDNALFELRENRYPLIETLLMATCYRKDAMLLDSGIPAMKDAMKQGFPEVDIYIAYWDCLEDRNKIDEYMEKYKKPKNSDSKINYDVEAKVFEIMFLTLEEIKAKEAERKEKASNSSKENLVFLKEIEKIKTDQRLCPHDKSWLTNKYCELANYKDGRKKEIKNKVKVRALYCSICNKYFVNSIILNGIRDSEGSRGEIPNIKIKTGALVRGSLRIGKSLECEESSKEEKVQNESYYDKFKEESDLKKLGYSTQVSRDRRWDILVNKVIPKVGVHRAINHIEYQIYLRSNCKTKDYSRAIGEWTHDLKKIKAKYFG